jgi:anaerobic selenocysteine-containing dehydrogenase
MDQREVVSFCRFCVAGCGIRVTVEGETVTRVRGDARHPLSRGYTCAKGRALPSFTTIRGDWTNRRSESARTGGS